MTVNNNQTDEITDIPLDSPTDMLTGDEQASSSPPAATAATTTTIDVSEMSTEELFTNRGTEDDDDEVNALLDELKEPTEQEIAVQKLRESTGKLAYAIKNVSSDIDTKLELSERAKGVDESLGLSRSASSAASAVGSFWSSLQVKERAQNVAESETVKKLSSSINQTLETTGVKSAVESGSQTIKNLDDQHKISTNAVGALADGVGWFAKSLNDVVGTGNQGDNR